MAGRTTSRIPMRARRLRLETPQTSSEGLLQPVRFKNVLAGITPAWRA